MYDEWKGDENFDVFSLGHLASLDIYTEEDLYNVLD
uniref:Uncharacterized protein n=1 Tax=viral metagenome TaxID=1070528 RepID=A0A6C0AFM5_9ZZZZ